MGGPAINLGNNVMFLDLPMVVKCLFFSVVRPVIAMVGPNKSLEEGDNANLTCYVIKGSPKPQLSIVKTEDPEEQPTIFKYGYLLFDMFKTTVTLVLTNITKRIEGRYTCIARNAGGHFTASKHITVKSKIIIIIINMLTMKSII